MYVCISPGHGLQCLSYYPQPNRLLALKCPLFFSWNLIKECPTKAYSLLLFSFIHHGLSTFSSLSRLTYLCLEQRLPPAIAENLSHSFLQQIVEYSYVASAMLEILNTSVFAFAGMSICAPKVSSWDTMVGLQSIQRSRTPSLHWCLRTPAL